jgi:hypothetical protein
MINPITQSNKWYDNLPDLKRDLFFLVFIFGSLIVAQFLMYVKDCIWSVPVWVIIWTLWRLPYILTKHKR